MDYLRHGCAVFLGLVLVVAAVPDRTSTAQNESPQQAGTSVRLRWEQRAGVSRYRLQVARESSFTDMVLDRLVTGPEHEIADLPPGRYFWRVAPLTTTLGAFSPARLIEVRSPAPKASPSPVAKVGEVSAGAIVAGGGWRAAVGDLRTLVAANLRSLDRVDIVVTKSDGTVLALDAASGVPLWSFRAFNQRASGTRAVNPTLLVVPKRPRLHNIVLIAGTEMVAIEGATGREIWRATLPATASAGAVVSDRNGSRLIIVDNSRQRLFIVRDVDGTVVAQLKLPGRVIDAPVGANHQGKTAFAMSYDNGDIEIRDVAGALIRSGNVVSPATTAPLSVRGRRGELILLGTREGLTAMAADDLRPLGRVAVKNDAPRGTLVSHDLDQDGALEVIMTTERRHLIAVDATDGRVVWDVPAENYGDSLAFADINGDGVSDVFVSGGQRFAVALSGRDGSVIWKDNEPLGLSTNHTEPFGSRGLIAVPAASGVLLIGVDPSRTGLRAIAFPNVAIRSNPR